jgi:hypothetical protein
VKRTILNLDNIVDKKLKKAKQNEFRYRVSESLQKKPPAYYQKKLETVNFLSKSKDTLSGSVLAGQHHAPGNALEEY